MKSTIKNFFVIIYVILAIFITICLLSYNEYKVTEFGEYSLLLIDNRDLEPDFEKGDLVIPDKTQKIEVGDKMFFYNTYSSRPDISMAEVIRIDDMGDEALYTVEGNILIEEEDVIGESSTATKISKLGGILGLLESKWGFLILVVFPSLIAFLYEIAELISELRNSKKNEN